MSFDVWVSDYTKKLNTEDYQMQVQDANVQQITVNSFIENYNNGSVKIKEESNNK